MTRAKHIAAQIGRCMTYALAIILFLLPWLLIFLAIIGLVASFRWMTSPSSTP